MAFEDAELLQLLSRAQAVDAKLDQVMRLFMLATAESLASGDLTPEDPEWRAMAARAEALGVDLLGKAAGSVEMFTRMASESAASPGGEAAAAAHLRTAAGAVALGARAHEYAAFMRDVGALAADSDRSQQGGPPRGGPGGPTPDTSARSGPTDGSSPAQQFLGSIIG